MQVHNDYYSLNYASLLFIALSLSSGVSQMVPLKVLSLATWALTMLELSRTLSVRSSCGAAGWSGTPENLATREEASSC